MTTFAVVTPAYRAEAEIGRCLQGLLEAGFHAEELLVVDDGSPDGTGARAVDFGARVLRNETPQGPARARNRGAAAVDAEVIVFVDADVVPHPGLRERLLAHFADPALDAVFGSYDDRPPAPSVVSRYRNLLHHHVHQTAPQEASTFWTGLGAVRRAAFLHLEGFDPAWENIEDVEFGLRLTRGGGRSRLDRDLQGTHLKAWTLRSMLRTDLHGRAKPWTRLLLRGDARLGALNTSTAHRVSALAVPACLAALALSPLEPRLLWAAGGAALIFGAVNRRFFAFLARHGGPGFALASAPFHAAHYLAALLGYVLARAEALLGRAPPQTREGSAGSGGEAPPPSET